MRLQMLYDAILVAGEWYQVKPGQIGQVYDGYQDIMIRFDTFDPTGSLNVMRSQIQGTWKSSITGA